MKICCYRFISSSKDGLLGVVGAEILCAIRTGSTTYKAWKEYRIGSSTYKVHGIHKTGGVEQPQGSYQFSLVFRYADYIISAGVFWSNFQVFCPAGFYARKLGMLAVWVVVI